MTRLCLCLAAFLISLLVWFQPRAFGDEVASPSIMSFTADPSRFEPDKATNVTFTTVLSAETLVQSVPQLERLRTDGEWENVKGTFKLVSVPHTKDRVYKIHHVFKEPYTGRIRLRLTLTPKSGSSFVSPIVTLSVGKIVYPSMVDKMDVPVEGPPDSPDRITVTVPAKALRGPAYVGIARTSAGLIGTPGHLTRVATFDLIFDPISPLDAHALTKPLIVSVPAPGAQPGTHFYFVQEVLADKATGGLAPQLLTMDEGIVNGATIVTDPTHPVLPGFFLGGVVAVLQVPGSGYIVGKVTDGSGNPRHGVWVWNVEDYSDPSASNVQGFFTDVNGEYALPVNGSWYKVAALDGFRCAQATAPKRDRLRPTDPTPKDVGTLVVNPTTAASPTRDGIRNGGFEVGMPTLCWSQLSQGQLDYDGSQNYQDLYSTRATIRASEGRWMTALTTDNPSIEQVFILPNGRTKLFIDYNFGCSQNNFNAGSCPDPNASTVGIRIQLVNPSNNQPLIPDFAANFPRSNGSAAWATAELDVSAIAAGTKIKLLLAMTTPDTNKQPVVLVDHIRFGAVVVTPNRLYTSSASATTMPDQILRQFADANEILSQAGVNVRLRRPLQDVNAQDGAQDQVKCNSGTLDPFGPDSGSNVSGTNITWAMGERPNPGDKNAGLRTAETRAWTCLAKKNAPTDPGSDVQIYYVNDLRDENLGLVYGAAVTAEDYHGEAPPKPLTYNATDQAANEFDYSAILLSSLTGSTSDPNRQKETPAHELGHLLLHSTVAGSAVEHMTPPGNIMTGYVCTPRHTTTRCSARPILDRTQSALFELPR